MMPRTFKGRLTLLYTAIFASLLLALAVYVHVSSVQRSWAAFDEDLVADANVLGGGYGEEMREVKEGLVEDWRGELSRCATLLRVSAGIVDAAGHVVFSTPGFEARAGAMEAEGRRISGAFFATSESGGRDRIAVVNVHSANTGPLRVVVVSSAAPLDARLSSQRVGLALCLPVLIALAAVTGHLFVRRGLRPVDEMAALAREISAGDLARRVPMPHSEGELRELAITLNGMLARLQESFGRLRSFTADAAHELRTPIASIRAGLENALHRPSDLRPAIGEALEEIESLGDLIEKLLLLARGDAGQLAIAREAVDVGPLVQQVVELAEAVAGHGRVRVEIAADLRCRGDHALLRRALHNIVDNAVKYGDASKPVVVRIGADGVRVTNQGVIPAEHLPRIFDRFYRVDPSRSRQPGHGLGLSIAKTIVKTHGGRIDVTSADGETTFRLVLPRDTAPALAGSRT